jgi:hypothetical protein
MKRTQKPEIIASVIGGIFQLVAALAAAYAAWYLNAQQIEQLNKVQKNNAGNIEKRLFGLCYAMDGGYKGWNPYIERHLAIFVNCFLSRAN